MILVQPVTNLFQTLTLQSQMTRHNKPAISDIHVSAGWNLLTLQRSKEYRFRVYSFSHTTSNLISSPLSSQVSVGLLYTLYSPLFLISVNW